MSSLQRFLKYGFQLYYRVSHGVSVHGLEKLPRSGPYIVASNHITCHDPVMLAAFLNHSIKFMAKEELFRNPFLRTILTRANAFPVRRSGLGIGAIRHAIRLLQTGETVGIFPEGTRNPDGRQTPGKPGVGFIATKSGGTTIVPVAICADQRRFFRQFQIVVGDPLPAADPNYRRLAEHVMQTIKGLRSSLEVASTPYAMGQESID